MKTHKYLLVVLLIIVPAVSIASIDANLSFGSRGQAVTDLQNLLIGKGFLSGQASGGFYSLTKRAVVTYQSSFGLPATGFVGPMTREKINKELVSTQLPIAAPAIQTIPAQTSPTTTIVPAVYSTGTTFIPTPVSINPTPDVTPTYITENTPFGPITYLSTIDSAAKAKIFADVQALATEAAKNGLVNFAPLPTPAQPPTDAESMAIINSLKAMHDACTEQPKLAFQADRGVGAAQVVFRASYSAACIVDPNMTWLFSDGNPNDAKSGTLGSGWAFGRLNSSTVYNLAIYSFSGVYPGITSFTFAVGNTTAVATIYK